MREVSAESVTEKIKELFLSANFYIGDDIMKELQRARDSEVSETGKAVLDMIIENDKIASREEIALCQDTGLAVVFAEIGQDVAITGGAFNAAVNEGVKAAYEDGYLRKSAVDDPVFDRVNTKTNTPAIIYTSIVPGDALRFIVTPKGFGSENMSALAMMKAADGAEGIVNFVVDTVVKAGPNPCPPTVVGVGIGGTADWAMMMAKKATIRPLGEHNPDERYAAMEREILEKVNKSGIGPAGLGGRTTALAVHVNYFPTHIAGMPVAVNICCHAARHAEGTL